jgi:hypothetical protein
MRNTVLSILILALLYAMMPAGVLADATDDCPRVGAYIERVGALIERAAPRILRSGNERAINLLNSAISELRAAHRAYEADMCRLAFNHAQQAEHLIMRALRLINRRNID